MDASEYRAALADALVREIKAEMVRKRIDSNRALAERAGVSRSSVNDRLSGATRTGRRTPITVPDLFTYAAALEVDATELLHRAMALVESDDQHEGRKAN